MWIKVRVHTARQKPWAVPHFATNRKPVRMAPYSLSAFGRFACSDSAVHMTRRRTEGAIERPRPRDPAFVQHEAQVGVAAESEGVVERAKHLPATIQKQGRNDDEVWPLHPFALGGTLPLSEVGACPDR